MKILFCTSECYPFISSGGLGDVAYSLPKALNNIKKNNESIDCRVILPLYKGISGEFKNKMEFITNFQVPVAWRQKYCGVFSLKYNGIIFYFIDNEYYFKRDNLYGYFDDGERFTFFSRAILELIKNIDFKPDVIHANDWQTALVPVFYKLIYKHQIEKPIKTIFTIHNIQYQGKFDRRIIRDIVGIQEENHYILDYDNCVNFMKGGIETADKVITVSKTYSKEILNPWFSHALHHALINNQQKISGIVNGIDTEVYNPETDKEIYQKYSKDTLNLREINKQKLCERLNLNYQRNVPLIGMVTRLVREKGIDLVIDTLERLMFDENILFVMLGSGDYDYESFFNYMQNKYKGRVSSCHGFVPELSHKIYSASDMFLMPSEKEPCGLSQMIALRYGSIPIVRNTGGLCDTISDSGDNLGNGFVFQNYDSNDLHHTIKRAINGYSNQNGWQVLVKRAMLCENSWTKSAEDYIKVYK